MLQYKIPQNVGIEDKIVGPFSLRQLIILAVGIGISYTIFAIASRIYELNAIEYFIIALPAIFALLLAVVKIHNVSFGKYLILLAEFAIKPKRRMWDHRGISYLVDPDLTEKKPQNTQEIKDREENKKNVNLSNLSMVLDSGGFEHLQEKEFEDIEEAEDDDLITEAYFGNKKKGKEDNMYWRTKEMQKKKLDLLAKMSKAKKPETKEELIPEAVEVKPEPAPTPIPQAPKPEPEKKESVVENLAKLIQEAKENNKEKKEAEAQAQKISPVPSSASKNRPRNKKPKTAQPVRKDVQINRTNPKDPKLIQKDDSHEKEMSLGDLKESGEIEFNLQ